MSTDQNHHPELQPEERTQCEVWSRVMGYHRPVSYWNIGKQQEHRDRKHFLEGKACLTPSPPPSSVEDCSPQ
ncbi:MAG: anaerobic ribonucleoside-triphosphate reductase [Candidatus Roseilinea sp.]|uniref:anaerobic ribonucleoside-triphosphate reductase n=1 Tax=Candidatus Roseilinea sp. TaxID=2838777 RepID=UPI00404B95D6